MLNKNAASILLSFAALFISVMAIYSPRVGAQTVNGATGQIDLSAVLPTGVMMMTRSSSCPSSWTEDPALSGQTLVGTIAASGNVGTTGGSNSITPVFTGTGGTTSSNGATTFTMVTNLSLLGILGNAALAAPTSITAHTHTLTPTGNIGSFDPHPAFTRVIFCSKD